MENATEALHMAFGVLIFVIALSISISSFGLAQTTAQYIIELKDRENDYQYIESSAEKSRIVGVETIVPTMYRAYRENYVIVFEVGEVKGVFEEDNSKTILFKKKKDNKGFANVYRLDLAESDLAIKNSQDATKFVDLLLYGKSDSTFSKVELQYSDGLYDLIKDYTFTETTGIYYIDDVVSVGDSSSSIAQSDANKIEKRVITYKLKKRIN